MNKRHMLKNNSLSGQAALIIILVVAVVITISVSTLNRTVTDVRIVTQKEESAKAYAAAQSAVERAMRVISLNPNTAESAAVCPAPSPLSSTTGTCFSRDSSSNRIDPRVDFWYTISSIESDYTVSSVRAGETYTLFLRPNSNNPFSRGAANIPYSGTVNLSWTTAARMEFILVYTDGTLDAGTTEPNILIERHVVPSGDRFSLNPTDGIFSATAYSNWYLLRIRPINNTIRDLNVSFTGGTVPRQGYEVIGYGRYVGSGINSQSILRRVRAVRWNNAPPAIFDYALYSGDSI